MAAKRRQKPRIQLRVAVELEQESRLQAFYSRNLSAGGIYIEMGDDAPPPIGSQLKLSFDIPGLKKKFKAEVKVLHHHSYETMDEEFKKTKRQGIGLQFLDLDQDARKLIEQYISGKDLHVRT